MVLSVTIIIMWRSSAVIIWLVTVMYSGLLELILSVDIGFVIPARVLLLRCVRPYIWLIPRVTPNLLLGWAPSMLLLHVGRVMIAILRLDVFLGFAFSWIPLISVISVFSVISIISVISLFSVLFVIWAFSYVFGQFRNGSVYFLRTGRLTQVLNHINPQCY